MLVAPLLTAFLLTKAPSPAEAELDACARRIEVLKARQQEGRELERLLRRAQELAAELDRAAAAAPEAPAAPSPEELRERADAARDEADRLAAEIHALDIRIDDARRVRGETGGPVARAALGTVPLGRGAVPGNDRVQALLLERAALAERRVRAETEAARLDAEARLAEGAL
jgi:hypothetical protein